MTFQKTTVVYHLNEKKEGHSPTFSCIANYVKFSLNSFIALKLNVCRAFFDFFMIFNLS